MDYAKSERTTLRGLGLDERWLQERIVEDPSILGLGDLSLLQRERPQLPGGKLDFLLADPEEEIRYEVEVMLGKLDESHIIRCIEYWDIERTRFPQLEHRAVIVAEDITNRFFNIIAILNRAVPIIAVQMNAVKIDDRFTLTFTKVLDIAELMLTDVEPPGPPVDRAYWENHFKPMSLAVVDRLVPLIQENGRAPRITYNKGHIAIGTTGRNFLWCHPRRNAPHCFLDLRIGGESRTDWIRRLDEAGIYAGPRGQNMKMRLTAQELSANSGLIKDLLASCDALERDDDAT